MLLYFISVTQKVNSDREDGAVTVTPLVTVRKRILV